MNAEAVLRTFASKPYVVVDREDRSVIGSSGNLAHARALGASKVGESGYRVVYLGDIAGFCEAAANAGDGVGVLVASLARGETMREIGLAFQISYVERIMGSAGAGWCHLPVLQSRTIPPRKLAATKIREVLGSLSRAKARRQVAAWILEGACG